MRTSLSSTTGRGVPAGTSSAIVPGDPVAVSEAVGSSACPKINPTDKKIKTNAERMGRIRFFLAFNLRSVAANCPIRNVHGQPSGKLCHQGCNTLTQCCMEGWACRALLVPLEAFHGNTMLRILPRETGVNCWAEE